MNTLPGLHYRFKDEGLLSQALTHRSCGAHNNERLEFLGDGLLNFVVADLLYHERPDVPEGDLSRLRARLVRDRTLARIAVELELGQYLRLGPGELKSGGYLRESILADAIEALIGAVYLDGGFDAARLLVQRLIATRLASLPDAESLKDAKTRLQEYLQAQGLALPEYSVLHEDGPDHARLFTVRCDVDLLQQPVVATAGSRRKAEQAAAAVALEQLQAQTLDPQT